MTFTNKVI